ncbi:MAG TPA: bifunctional phosphopantothenoylcysteine decarboxylase/phosphopantothenate--cysteine ligase CoaBC [Bacillota bacterium]|nr:bifunctional phosphopantothenoylcysteine decarboxylase/phosphopantothenate--cysteine ligase CoaBC [Bacillota bacterium]
MLSGKTVAVGVTGGIAVYKAAQLVSDLKAGGAEVHVIMTRSAKEFVRPLTFQVLSGNRVHTDLFEPAADGSVRHIGLATRPDLLVIVPATANIIGKVAGGIADDLLSTVIMAAACPVLFCPAMNVNMYDNRIVQRNLNILRDSGYHFVGPGTGRLACGVSGRGRLADLEDIMERIILLLNRDGDLKGLVVLITAGPTVEPMDPVRYISNRSSGKMGYTLAQAAARRGAKVVLISGPTALKPPYGVELIKVETAAQMYDAVMEKFNHADVVIKSAAVADYRPGMVSGQKIKKHGDRLTVELVKNPDILAELGRKKTCQILVGFAAETEELENNAMRKVTSKNLDFLVANDVTQAGAGFGSDTNIAKFVYPDGTITTLPQMEKSALAHRILDEVVNLLRIEQ